MRSLGDHAKSSRQPPLKERKSAKADASAPAQVALVEDILENGATHEGAAAVIAEDVTSQIVVQENGNGAVAEITPSEDAGEIATATLVAVEFEPQSTATDYVATQATAVQEDDDTSAAKRAIIHEWENWSALHSDELNDPNVAEYFFRHLQARKPCLLSFELEYPRALVQSIIVGLSRSNR
jgi:hypothetical protein